MKRLLVALTLIISLLCGCAANALPTAPPTPTAPSTEDPRPASLEGVGTICDALPDGNGYIVMTHTGFYRLDKELRRAEATGLETYNALFEDAASENPFYRMKLDPDYELPLLTALTQTSRGLAFFCYSNGTFYLDGKPWFDARSYINAVDLHDMYGTVSPRCKVQVIEYDGAIYTMIYGAACSLLMRDGKQCLNLPERDETYEQGTLRAFTGLALLDGRLFAGVGCFNSYNDYAQPNSTRLLPVDGADFRLSYENSRSGLGVLTASAQSGEAFYFTTSSSELFCTDGTLLRMQTLQEQVRTLHTDGEGLLAVTCENKLERFVPEFERSLRMTELRLGYLAGERDENGEPAFVLGSAPDVFYPVLASLASYPGLAVTAVAYDTPEALARAAAAGEVDLLAATLSDALLPAAQQGLLCDLTECCPELFRQGVLAPAVLNAYRTDEGCYALPMQFLLRGRMFYNASETIIGSGAQIPQLSLSSLLAKVGGSHTSDGVYRAYDLYEPQSMFSTLCNELTDAVIDPESDALRLPQSAFIEILNFCGRFKQTVQFDDYNALYTVRSKLSFRVGGERGFYNVSFLASPISRQSEQFLCIEGLTRMPCLPDVYNFLSVVRGGAQEAEAQAIVTYLLTDETLPVRLGSKTLRERGILPLMPTTRAALVAQTDRLLDPNEGYSYSDLSRERAKALLLSIFDNVQMVYGQAAPLREAVGAALTEAAARYFGGTMTAEQAAAYAQSLLDALRR